MMQALLARQCPICGERLEVRDPKAFGGALREHTRTVHPGYFRWTRRFRVLIIPVFATSTSLAFILTIFLPGLGGEIEPVLGFVGFIAPLAILALIGRHIMKSYQADWARDRAGRSPPSVPLPAFAEFDRPTLPSSDRSIIEIIRESSRQLEISHFEPTSISWQDYSNTGGKTRFGPFSFRTDNPRLVPYDGCAFEQGKIILPESTKNKLDPEEWAPIVVSELVYQNKFRKRRRLGLLIRIVPATAIYMIIPVVLWLLGILNLQGTTTVRGAPTPLAVAFFQIYSGTALIFAMILYILIGLRFDRKLRLLSDQETAGLTGKRVFLSALGKIGQAFPEIMRGKRPSTAYPPARPGIQQRIDAVNASNGL